MAASLTTNGPGWLSRLWSNGARPQNTVPNWEVQRQRRISYQNASEWGPKMTNALQLLFALLFSLLTSLSVIGGVTMIIANSSWASIEFENLIETWLLWSLTVIGAGLLLRYVFTIDKTVEVKPGQEGFMLLLGYWKWQSRKLTAGIHGQWLPESLLSIQVLNKGGESGGPSFDVTDIRGITARTPGGGSVELGDRRGNGIAVTVMPLLVDPWEAIELAGQSDEGGVAIGRKIDDICRVEIANALSECEYIRDIEHAQNRGQLVMNHLRGLVDSNGQSRVIMIPEGAPLGQGNEVFLLGAGYAADAAQIKEALAIDDTVIKARADGFLSEQRLKAVRTTVAGLVKLNKKQGTKIDVEGTALLMLDYVKEEKISRNIHDVGPRLEGSIKEVLGGLKGFTPEIIRDITASVADALKKKSASGSSAASGGPRKSGGSGSGRKPGHGSR